MNGKRKMFLKKVTWILGYNMYCRKKIEKMQTEGWNVSQRRKGEGIRKKLTLGQQGIRSKNFPEYMGLMRSGGSTPGSAFSVSLCSSGCWANWHSEGAITKPIWGSGRSVSASSPGRVSPMSTSTGGSVSALGFITTQVDSPPGSPLPSIPRAGILPTDAPNPSGSPVTGHLLPPEACGFPHSRPSGGCVTLPGQYPARKRSFSKPTLPGKAPRGGFVSCEAEILLSPKLLPSMKVLEIFCLFNLSSSPLLEGDLISGDAILSSYVLLHGKSFPKPTLSPSSVGDVVPVMTLLSSKSFFPSRASSTSMLRGDFLPDTAIPGPRALISDG